MKTELIIPKIYDDVLKEERFAAFMNLAQFVYMDADTEINIADTIKNMELELSNIADVVLNTAVGVRGFSLPVDAWSMGDNGAKFVWQANIPLDGVTPMDVIDVSFDVSSLDIVFDAMISPASKELDGAVRIYAMHKPLDTLTGRCVIMKGGA